MTADTDLRPRLAAPVWFAALGAGVLLLAVLAGVVIGEMPLPVETVAAVLGNRLLGTAQPVDAIDAAIIWNYRLPRTLVAAACGAGSRGMNSCATQP